MATIDNLSISITAQATDATKKIDALSNALKNFKSSSNLASAVNNLTKLKEALSALNRIRVNTDKLRSVSSGIRSINNAISGISNASVNRLERLVTALQSLGGVRRISQSARQAIQDTMNRNEPRESETQRREETQETAQGATNAMNRTSDATRHAIHWFDALRQRISGIARVAGPALGRTLATPFIMFGRVIRGVLRPLAGLLRSLGRIAMYRLLRSVIKAITQGVKEGVENLVRFSKLMNELDSNKANRVMSLYASNFLYLKNTLATAVIPVLKALEPIIDILINKFIDFVNVIAQLFSAISGSATYTKAKYFFVDYAESLDKAGGSAGKLNKQLAKFDELNNLTTNKGSGSGYSDDDILKMFTDPVPIADWILKLKEYIADGDWYTVGQTLSLKLRDSLRSIDWDEIGNASAKRGKGLAGFFNGLIRPDTAYEIGKALVGIINTAFRFFNSWSSTMDWKNVGASFASFLNGIIQNAKPEELADAINNMVTAFLNFACGFFSNFDWYTALTNMFNVLKNLDVSTYAVMVGAFLLRVFTVAGTAEGYSFGQLIGSAIIAGIGGYLIGNGLGQIWASVTGNNELLWDYQDANPFTSGSTGDAVFDFFDEEIFSPWGTTVGIQKRQAERTANQYKAVSYELTKATEKLKEFYTAEHRGGEQMQDDVKQFLQQGIVPTYWTSELESAMRDYKSYYDSLKGTWYDSSPVEFFWSLGNPDLLQPNTEGIEKVDEALKNLSNTIDKLEGDLKKLKSTGKDSFGFLVKEAFGLETSVAIDINNIIKNLDNGIVNVELMGSAFGSIAEAVRTTDLETILPFFKDSRWLAFYNVIKNNLSYEQFLEIGNNMGTGMSTSFAKAMATIEKAYNAIKEQIMKDPLHIDFRAIIDIVQTTYKQVVQDLTPRDNTQNKTGMPSYVEEALNKGTTPSANKNDSVTINSIPARLKLPDVPSYIPSSQAQSWLAEWKRKNPAQSYYENGGFPDAGSMFIAGEAGAELVGNFNGRTGVANTDQITEAMYTATYDAMSTALAENPSRFIIEGDADGMFRIMQQKANNFFTRTGRTAF